MTDSARREMLRHELDRLLETIIAEYKPKAVYLYGALANDNVSEWSDLDLVIIKDTDERFFDRIATVLKLTNPRFGTDICVYTSQEWSQLSQERAFIREEVLKRGRLLYAA